MKRRKKDSLFPVSIFFVYLLVLLMMAGIHTGILTLMEVWKWNNNVQIVVPILYWSAIAGGLTLFTRWRVKQIGRAHV